MKKSSYPFVFSVLIAGFVWACANVGMPSGGLKDETPPVLVKSIPENNALNYNKKEVIIEFDELIQLKDVMQKFVISPPLNEQPTIEARGNKLMIVFNEDLQPNTTYSLDFADAVADNNEGNILENFSFSFSTGEYIDSLKISGNVWDADDLSPSEGVIVLLHSNLNDTAVQKLVPLRMAKTNSQGRFTILNVSPGQYKIYALEDANRNFKFDQPGERMAWSDKIIEPSFEYRDFADTIKIDSLETDSLVYHKELVYTPDSVMLFLFQHDYKRQYLVSEERKEKSKLTFFFNRANTDPVNISLTDKENEEGLFIKDCSLASDTVSFWLTDSTYYNQDSISVSLEYTMLDSLNNPYRQNDTIAMYFFEIEEKKKGGRKKKGEEEEVIELLKLKDVKSKIDIFGSFSFSLPSPAVSFDKSAVQFYHYEDTLAVPFDLELEQDSHNIRKYSARYDWEPGGKYEMTIDSAAIVDIYGLHNGPTKVGMNIKKDEDYGIIYMEIANPHENWLVQVISKNGKVVQQQRCASNGKIGFRYLSPGKYMLRILVDENQNGQWDNGNYELNQQPEELIYFPDEIDVRANWDRNLNVWDPYQFSVDKFSKQFRKPKKRE